MPNLILRVFTLTLLTALISACSWFGERPPEYVDSEEVAPIRVPEDLDAPVYRAPLVITIKEMRVPTGDELNPGPPRTVATGGRSDTNAFMAWSARGVYLQVRDTPDSVARRLGYAIERSGMKLLDRSEDGEYHFEYYHLKQDDRSIWQKMAFWRNDGGDNYSGIYRAKIVPDGQETRIYLLFDSGEPATTNAAEHVLGIFMERLG